MTTPRPPRLLAAAFYILAALIFALPSAARQKSKAPAAPLDLEGYVAALGRCASQIPRLQHNPAEIAGFRDSLPPQWNVRADGRDFRVSTAWLDAALAEIQKHPTEARAEWREILGHLDFLRAQAEALAAPSTVASAAAARPQLDAIFRRTEFRDLAGPSTLQRWWSRVTTWIGMQIARLLARLHLGARMGNFVAYGLIALALVLLSVTLWRALAGRSRQIELEIGEPAPAIDWRTWIREALGAAERGRFREAIHAAYWGAVARLEDAGAFPRDRSRTPRELLRLLDSRPDQKAPFRDLAARFELVWYGYRSPSSADWESTRTQLERMGCLGISTAGTGNS